jgi:hypothetical protein
MIDFLLYKPDPRQVDSLRSAPAEKEFTRDLKRDTLKVEFFNGNADPILVHFLEPLHASQNPLKVQPGRSASVRITPMIGGRFPCQVEILASICPTCDSRLAGNKVVRVRPDPSLPLDAAGDCCAAAGAGRHAMQMKSGVDEGDPVIIIKP